jgi:hypothetical protein
MRNQTLEFMTANFGKAGTYYYWISRGIDERPVRANRIRKSVGAENTFSQDLADYEALAAELQPLIEKVWRHYEITGARARTATLKVKFSDFELITRSRSVAVIDSANDLSSLALELLRHLMPPKKAIRLLGISVSDLLIPNLKTKINCRLCWMDSASGCDCFFGCNSGMSSALPSRSSQGGLQPGFLLLPTGFFGLRSFLERLELSLNVRSVHFVLPTGRIQGALRLVDGLLAPFALLTLSGLFLRACGASVSSRK